MLLAVLLTLSNCRGLSVCCWFGFRCHLIIESGDMSYCERPQPTLIRLQWFGFLFNRLCVQQLSSGMHFLNCESAGARSEASVCGTRCFDLAIVPVSLPLWCSVPPLCDEGCAVVFFGIRSCVAAMRLLGSTICLHFQMG